MKFKQHERRLGALARRKENIIQYKKLMEAELPQTFKDKTFKNKKEWNSFLQDKINKAEKDIKKLEELVSY